MLVGEVHESHVTQRFAKRISRMTRLILITVTLLATLWVLLGLGVVPQPLARLVQPVVGLACSLAIPALIITSYAAPGLLRDVVADGLLDIDILARLAGMNGLQSMPMVRGADDDGVHILQFQEPAVILKLPGRAADFF